MIVAYLVGASMGLREVLEATEILKNIPRIGWLQSGVPLGSVESVAEHVFQTSIIALLISSYLEEEGLEIDIKYVLVRALTHDLSEAITGDIPRSTTNLLGGEVKDKIESLGLAKILKDTPLERLLEPSPSKDRRMEESIVKIADYMSALLKGLEYERLGYRVGRIIKSSKDEVKRLCRENDKLREITQTLLKIMEIENTSTS